MKNYKLRILVGAFAIFQSAPSLSMLKDQITIPQQISATLNKADLKLEQASIDLKEFLIDFAIRSHDTHKTRTASDETAREVLAINNDTFLKSGVFVCRYHNVIVGFFTLKFDKPLPENTCELGHLFVAPGWQRKGIGSYLFEQIKLKAGNAGYKRLFWVSDPATAKFYRDRGANQTKTDKNLLDDDPLKPVPVFELDLTK